MDCSQILPGAVNPGTCSLAVGYYCGSPFVAYASGKDLVILDGRMKHLQTVLGSDCGYGDTQISCIHCAELVGRIAVAWGSDVVIFEPEQSDELSASSSSNEFPGQWRSTQTLTLDYPVLTLCWNQLGSHLIIGGEFLTMWNFDASSELAPPPSEREGQGVGGTGRWKEVWRCKMALPVVHLKFSPDGAMFASASEQTDCLVKIWYHSNPVLGGIGSGQQYSFVYIAHPRAVTGFMWRNTSPFMPRGCVANVLLTYCQDNICRLWSHSLSTDKQQRLRFFIAASIDPIADIPFRSTMPMQNMPFIVHWLNNKETTFTSKADKTHKGTFQPLSRYSSLASFASSLNEEILQSWVCIEEDEDHSTDPSSSIRKPPHVYSFSSFLSMSLQKPSPRLAQSSPQQQDSRVTVQVRQFAQLLHEWYTSPDLLLCIHPKVGSLMVWTVEGLDAPHDTARLVHVSFSSCLPHIFPPHLAQTLRQELFQFLIKEPDVVHTSEMDAAGSITDISLPVPQIRITSSGSMSDMVSKEDVPKTKADSTLILVSSHLNGSLNSWSVELTVQSNSCTSIAGFIHCGGTGGHHSEVRAIHRHPWLPVLMTVSSHGASSERKSINGVESELIIWNADLPGPLEHKSRLNELSRMFSPDPHSFRYVTWVPPISVGGSNEGAFSRCPSSGLFVANVGNELRLYQTSLYCVTKPQPIPSPREGFSPPPTVQTVTNSILTSSGSQDVIVTSHLGKEGISVITAIEKDLSSFDQIVSLNAFRMCSLVTSFDIKSSPNSKFCRDIVIVLVENQTVGASSPTSRGTRSFLHLWRVTVCSKLPAKPVSPPGWRQPPTTQGSPDSTLKLQPVTYTATVEKAFSAPFPLPSNTHIVQSTPACDIASSLQLQLPTLSAPYLFTTACSDGTVRCWQIALKSLTDGGIEVAASSTEQPTCTCSEEKQENLEFRMYEVFGASSAKESESCPGTTQCLDCYDEGALKDLPTLSYVPCAISSAYPGRFAMAHLLAKSAQNVGSPPKRFRKPSSAANPLDQHAVVSVWECESSGGLKWSCEATLPLSGLMGVVTAKSSSTNVLLEWLPMENGAYLLATCFASIISIFGMTLPQAEVQSTTSSSSSLNSFRSITEATTTTLSTGKSKALCVCLLQFPCSKPYPGLSISCFSYTGSNSLLLSIGSEMHLYSCWVKGSRLQAFTPSKEDRKLVSKSPSRVFREGSPGETSSKLTDTDIINLLDYAHARNTPLPQYHPKILTELMNSGKLHAVKAILINLVKYLLLYKGKTKQRNYFEDGGFEALYDDASEEETQRTRLLSVSADGYLRRSKKVKPKIMVDCIPQLPLSKLGIFKRKDAVEPQEEKEVTTQEDEDYDDLFTSTLTPIEDLAYGFEDEAKEMAFSDLDPETSEFLPRMAQKLSSILKYAQLADLSDLEQVRLLAIAETVANTKTSTSDQQGSAVSTSYDIGLGLSNPMGAGYASTGLSHGVRGGEAMDDCGLRYLLALENYVTLSQSLPKGVTPGKVAPADFIWAFHSDAEMELLSAVPCVQMDELSWAELRNAGVGWWLRSSDTLRRVMEKLAKTQFMEKQDPLDASLFYLAMKKKTLLKGLFRTVHDNRMMAFFSNNFTEERWKKAALKNAFALLAKQRFEHAAAFFLLAGKLWDAVEVCITRLGDPQLAFVITRLYEGDNGPVYERLLKESILGIYVDQSRLSTRSHQLEANPDPFMRSIAHWLLLDYSGALETLLVTPAETVLGGKGKVARMVQEHAPDPAIFNFYFFLRSHPLLLRRGYGSCAAKSPFQTQLHPSKSHWAFGHPLSGVGDEPLTPMERGLLFSTAYHHLTHGCPLLALDVLSKLPKSCNLGSEVCRPCVNNADMDSKGEDSFLTTINSRSDVESHGVTPADYSMTGMIQTGTLGDDFDWSQPVSTHLGSVDDDFDWGQPVSGQLEAVSDASEHGDEDQDDEIDWSKPVSSQKLQLDLSDLSPPNIHHQPSPEKQEQDGDKAKGDEETDGASTTLSTWGLFILSLAEQLQYNACLSILTEELNTIYIPACCKYLWKTKGKAALPLLPLEVRTTNQTLTAYYGGNAFEKTVLSLRGMLVEWLRRETKIVKEVCRFELVEEEQEDVQENAAPAGYDLLTTLMNYTALHAATAPSLLTVKLELMHLMNTLLPWDTGLAQIVHDLDTDPLSVIPTCAVDPAQLPILTSCSLPAKHLTNLALHLRLMSASIVEILANHTCPPVSSKSLPHVSEVFDLCCAISHCVTVCLSPMRLADISMATTNTAAGTPSQSLSQSYRMEKQHIVEGRSPKGSPFLSSVEGLTPKGSPFLSSGRPKKETPGSPFDFFHHLDNPNSKPSKWPGVDNWPNTLSSDEGKDPTPLSLVLVECSIAVYLGLLAASWSWHSPSDLLTLLKNAPTQDIWYSAFGGGVDVRKGDEKGKRTKSALMQKVDAMTKRIKMMRKGSSDTLEEEWSATIGLFISPKRTLLNHYLAMPTQDRWKEDLHESEVGAGDDVDLELELEESDGGLYMEVGPSFHPGSKEEENDDHNNPDSFPWCLLNLCITKMVQEAVRKVLSTAGLEVLELVTASPLLYSALKVMDEWESIFTRRLDALGGAPDDLFDNKGEESPMFGGIGPALMKHKFILEPGNSPFRSHSNLAKDAKQLWEYLVHQEEVRETFIHYIFTTKRVGSVEDDEPECRVVHKDADSAVSSFCINSCNTSVLALALPREVIEIEVPDVSALDSAPYGEDASEGSTPPTVSGKRHSIGFAEDEFVLVQSASFRQTQRHSVIHPSITYAHGMHAQTGGSSSMLIRRPTPGVRRMASHPNLTYYLTGSLDGSVTMWEFSTPRPVTIQRSPGTGAITRIRFTPQGNKYGITDAVGKLQLWQGIHTSTRTPYQTLVSGMRHLTDFLFLGSSSYLAACGDAADNKNLYMWDTLLPPKRSIVKEYICHESGATSLGYSQSKQRLLCGGKKGEVCIFDIRQHALLQCLPLHNAAVNCIAVNDVDGYFVTGSADGDIKVLDLNTITELASFTGEHARSRLFRSEGGVTDLSIMPHGKLYSCGADGTIKSRTLNFR